MMRVLSGICVIIILLSINTAQSYSLEDSDSTYDQRDASILYLRQVLKRIKSNRHDNLQWRKRTDATSNKCKEINSNTYYGGDIGPAINNMTTYRDCMNLCETDSKCYGWHYLSYTKECWLHTSIGPSYYSVYYTGGTCFGPAAKETHCTEVINGGAYNGNAGAVISQVATYQDCMSRCDASATCMAWSYAASYSMCVLQITAYGRVIDNLAIGGSCIKKQAPYPPLTTTTGPPVTTTTRPPVTTRTRPPLTTTTRPPVIPIIGTNATLTKCKDIKSGSYYDGDIAPSIDNIATYRDCMNLCEADGKCYGWSYQNSSQSCWLQTSVDRLHPDNTKMGGYCLGPAAKETHCNEVINGSFYYTNYPGPPINNVATYQDCMSRCDASATCMAWYYVASTKFCQLLTIVDFQILDVGSITGSCIKKQAPYPPISIETFRQQALDQHNFHRAEHCTPPLILDPALNDIAQRYAEHLAVTNVMTHSGASFNGQYMGECLYKASSLKVFNDKGAASVDFWYNEIENYNWSNPTAAYNTGHFMQVMWRDTTRLGIGRALTSDNRTMWVVGNYFPGGNVPGEYEENVLPIC
ncbi:unnamed protein product [Adineta steineri]|uniref:Apple domain-containing protein n=1 Tax=Adineta steineri TaxID=433720 RepID=A0A815IQB5_9BILA|nr:unnamed protein product [Adineta steineri]